MHTGSCLCAGVKFRIKGALAPLQICHCSQCRKAQGAPFATNAPVRTAAFTLLSGASLLTEYESSAGKFRVFCSRCGSPVYSRRAALPDVIRVRVGLIDEPVTIKPLAHFYTDSKAGWWPINDALPQVGGAAAVNPDTVNQGDD